MISKTVLLYVLAEQKMHGHLKCSEEFSMFINLFFISSFCDNTLSRDYKAMTTAREPYEAIILVSYTRV